MEHKKILCSHCNTHIGNLHAESHHEYKAPTTVVATKNGCLKKVRFSGTRMIDRYDSNTGFRVQFQIECLDCQKNTTNISTKDY